MEKVWFKLRQTDHYPPSEDIILLGDGDDSQASICLGHFISDLKRLDFPLNRDSVLPFHRRMTVRRNSVLQFTWDDSKNTAPGINLAASAPVLAAAGMTVGASLQTTFMRTVADHESYDRLDTYTVQPREDYIGKCLQQEKLKQHVDGKAFWSMFMITGIKVARAGKREMEEGKGTTVDVGPNVEIPGIATFTATANLNREASQKSSGTYTGDFIWAIRLAKVHKGLLMRHWSVAVHTERATFNSEEGDADIEGALKEEGLEGFQIFDDSELDEAIVLDKSII
ncbi:uncharacterized protein B0J16DRAFT_400187 [Fusarium flagelliforme]|uniref:uncharacterized protein n=1 Tax=Fusarium flagelliforme TaxID=2675880 RepID=UPI001E8D909A|nr:uncharacterized protein B0J16DRAFT_400187 [Fusarium flagelliforme]KAH7186195.1 hypothetical protein B0J16DRAFT_400187 [Fusarium flagelliforme]